MVLDSVKLTPLSITLIGWILIEALKLFEGYLSRRLWESGSVFCFQVMSWALGSTIHSYDGVLSYHRPQAVRTITHGPNALKM